MFWLNSVTFLGYIIFSEGVKVDPRKMEAVKNWFGPLTPTDIRSFLGIAGYIRGSWIVLHPLHLP